MKASQHLLQQVPYKEAIDLLEQLVSVNTVNPPGNEITLKPIVKSAFDALGAKMQIYQKQKGRANFIGKIGSGSPSIGFFPHLDTVPAGDGWKTDPWKPTIKNGKMYGRGTIDSKGNFAASWAGIKLFLERNKKFKGTLYLVGCADEEMGSVHGLHYLLEQGFHVDFAIVPDGGYIDKVIIGEKGILRLKIKSFGIQAHGSSPDQGVNAIDHLLWFLQRFHEIDFSAFSYHEAFSGITKNVGTIQGGHAVNIVPGYAEAEIDIRFPLGVDAKDILEKIDVKEKELKKKFPRAAIIIEESLLAPPHLTEQNTTLMQAFLTAAEQMKMSLRIGTMGGVTDAKPLSLAGIPTLVHSLDDGGHAAHNANEYVKLENIRIAAVLYCLTLEKLLLSSFH